MRAATVEELQRATSQARDGDTIILADGHYFVPSLVRIKASDVVLRSASGRRERVILDGAKSRHGELLTLTGCSGVVVADLTVQNVRWNGIKLDSHLGTTRTTIHNCVLHNIWQRAIKGPKVPAADKEKFSPRDVRIQHCLFYNDRAKELTDDPDDRTGDYIGGIDCMDCRGWTISDNVFFRIQGKTRQARGAVFLWQDSRDCLVERNVVIDCDSGLCLGNGQPPTEGMHCTGCIVRNNFVAQAPESGILADYTRDCRIVHNTVWDPRSTKRRLIRIVDPNEGLVVANNLLVGPAIRLETDSPIAITGNVTLGELPGLTAPQHGNLHLGQAVAGVSDAALPVKDGTHDFDGHKRDDKPDVGADERDEAAAPQ